jgi:integrase
MGTIVKRGGVFRGVVRKTGAKAITKSFDTRRAAQGWINETEVTIKDRLQYAGGHTLGQVLLRFSDEVISRRKYSTHSTTNHIKKLARQFAEVELAQMTTEWYVNTVRKWDLMPSSCMRYFILIGSALKYVEAIDPDVKVDWASRRRALRLLNHQNLIGTSAHRTRRLSDRELATIYAQRTIEPTIPMVDLCEFALATAMRVGEICRITWDDLDDTVKAPMIWIRDRKHPKKKMGNDSEIPLFGDALKIIRRQPRAPGEARIFPYLPASVSQAFRHAAAQAGVKSVVFHDLRHEAITRLFEGGYSIPEVALVSGHKTWKNLEIYTQLKAKALHSGPLARRAA